MLAKRIIPCLDVHAGRVVKGVNFLNLRDAGDPVDVAARYEDEGADELVFLDITASHEQRDIILDVVQRTSEVIFMPLTVGGGIRTLEDIRVLLSAGCDKVSINSAAVTDPEFVHEAARRFGSQCIVVNIDPKRITKDGKEFWDVHINGGRVPTGLQAVEWAREVERLGAGEIVLTSMDADSTSRSPAPSRRRSTYPSSRAAERVARSTCTKRSPLEGPAPLWLPAFSTTELTRSTKPNNTWPNVASPYATIVRSIDELNAARAALVLCQFLKMGWDDLCEPDNGGRICSPHPKIKA